MLLFPTSIPFASGRFAMKGGTALNLFVQDMPRPFVDIDVVFVPHRTPRETALAEISSELSALQTRINRRGIKAEIASRKTGDETKLLARHDRIEVKIEINHVFRGTLLPVETRSLTKTASDLFTTALAVPTLAVAELYGSKLVAAMDRHHPRDLFDVHGMFNRFGLTPEIVECFVGYIAGHNRPVHEVLGSRDIDLARTFENEFAGMEREQARRRFEAKGMSLDFARYSGLEPDQIAAEKHRAWQERLTILAEGAKVDLTCLPAKKSTAEKVLLAAAMKRSSSVSNAWLADRLRMGKPATVSQYVRRWSLDPKRKRETESLFQKSSSDPLWSPKVAAVTSGCMDAQVETYVLIGRLVGAKPRPR